MFERLSFHGWACVCKVGTAGIIKPTSHAKVERLMFKVGKPKNPSTNHHAGRLVGYSYGSSLVQVIVKRTNGIGMLNGNLKRSKRFSSKKINMIQATDLRIGNKFSKFNPLNGGIKFITINESDIMDAAITPSIFNGMYLPIPLKADILEDILKNNGFYKQEDSGSEQYTVRYTKNRLDLRFPTGPFDLRCIKDINIAMVSIIMPCGNKKCAMGVLDHIKYLHQLQNLYFALTGKELAIEL